MEKQYSIVWVNLHVSGLSLLGILRSVGFWIYAKPSQDDARGKVAAWFDICITVGLPSPLASILIVTFPLSQGSHASRGISGRK